MREPQKRARAEVSFLCKGPNGKGVWSHVPIGPGCCPLNSALDIVAMATGPVWDE